VSCCWCAGVQWLEVKQTDDEKTRNKKKKLQKSWKSKLRFQRLDLETKQRQQSWLDFKKGKGAKKKVCRMCRVAQRWKELA
jgi:survival-of-motor-neuron-related-splicing factor 30